MCLDNHEAYALDNHKACVWFITKREATLAWVMIMPLFADVMPPRTIKPCNNPPRDSLRMVRPEGEVGGVMVVRGYIVIIRGEILSDKLEGGHL